MQFKADARELRALVGELNSIVRPDSKADVKPGVSFELKGTVLQMRVCDLQGTYYSERTINVDPIKEGSVVLDLAHLNNILSAQIGTLEIEASGQDNGALKQGRTNLVLFTLPYDVHKIDAPKDGWHYNDEAAPIVIAVAKANRNRDPDDDPRYAIGGIAFQKHDGKLEVVGTNGISISAVLTEMPFEIDQDLIVVRPELATILGTYEKGRNLSLAITDEGLWLKQNERLDLTSIVTEPYPNYHEIVDADAINCGLLDREACIRLRNVVQKGVVGTNQHGHVWIKADGTGIIVGNERDHIQDIECSVLNLPPISVMADNLASILNMFSEDIDVSMNKDKTHLYLEQGNQFALLLIEDSKEQKDG